MTADRRQFLVCATGSVLAHAELRIPIAMLGGFHSHAEGKFQVLRESPDFVLAGIWEPDAALMRRYESAGARALELDAVLADAAIPAVAVESAVKDNGGLALRALEAGKHVHLEKPPATNLDQFRRIADLAVRKRRVLQIGYMWRYNPGVNYLVDAVRSGALGDVYLFTGVIDTLIPDRRRPEWGLFRGGHMFELGSHVIEVMVRMLGRPVEVTPVLAHHGQQTDKLNDNTLAVFRFPQAIAVVHGATLQPKAGPHRRIEVRGSNGVMVLEPIEQPAVKMDLAKPVGRYAAGLREVSMPPYRRYIEDFRRFAAAIHGTQPLSETLEHELIVQEVLLRASGMA